MGAREVGWRLRQAASARLEQLGFGLARPRPPRGPCGEPWVAPLPRGFDAGLYVRAAEAVLAGRWTVFAMRDADLGFPPRWNVDPKTGTEGPARFGKSINYRDERQVGDVKYLWEINRHLQLVTLAQAWHLSREQRFAQGCRQLLDSWFEQCRYPLGPNWTSSLEAGYRLVNWAIAWHLLGGERSALFDGESGRQFRERWLGGVREHCHFIAGWLSRYSSANNHLLGEYMGLFVAAVTWPLWPESASWQQSAREGFESEVLLQNAPDGVNREQAIYYQHEVMDMMLVCALFARRNGIEFDQAFWDRLERMFEFVAALMDRSGNLPMIGDSDDALIARWSQEESWHPFRSLLATGAIIFGRGDWKAKAGRCDDKTRWLLGDGADETFAAIMDTGTEARPSTFPVGGYYVLGGRFGHDEEILVVVDCGPIGYGSIAAHGHADALSLNMSLGGVPILIDPGTYAYHTGNKWRDYFRSTRAHNTVCIDGLDQSSSGGNFLWLQKAVTLCTDVFVGPGVQRFEGEHDGYRRLSDPVTHVRRINLQLEENRLVVEDELRCRGKHQADVHWHFAEFCAVSSDGNNLVAVGKDVRLEMTMTPNHGKLRLVRGDGQPPAGWISRAYDVKEPTTTAIWSVALDGDVCVKTTMIFAGLPKSGDDAL